MTTIPQPFDLTAGYTGIWDAWNRLTALKSGSNYVMSFLYDGLNRRGMRKSYDGSGTLTESRFFTYSEQWQILEEYVGGESTTPVIQWVWGLRYIDDCVLRDTLNTDGTLNLRLYALQDANWNVVALFDPTADDGRRPVERYAYTPYGVPLFLAENFTPLTANVSAYAWETLYCGYRYDATVGLYIVRNRWLPPPLGCWLSRDPADAEDGVYTYGRSNPIMSLDPAGLDCIRQVTPAPKFSPVRIFVYAATTGLTVSAGLSPKLLNMVPAHTLACTRTRSVTADYHCLCPCWFCFLCNSDETATTQLSETVEYRLPKSQYVLVISVSLGVVRTPIRVPTIAFVWQQIAPKDQASADLSCQAAPFKKPWLAPPTLNC